MAKRVKPYGANCPKHTEGGRKQFFLAMPGIRQDT